MRGKDKKYNLIGQTFGRWSVLATAPSRIYKSKKTRTTYWKCICSCGKIKEVLQNHLIEGTSKSCGCYQKDKVTKPKGEATFFSIWKTYQRSAKLRGLQFNLTKKLFRSLVTQECYYCGQLPKFVQRSKTANGGFYCNGIDRIDSTVGYIKTNVIPCCKECNYMKRTMPLNDFLSRVKNIALRHCI